MPQLLVEKVARTSCPQAGGPRYSTRNGGITYHQKIGLVFLENLLMLLRERFEGEAKALRQEMQNIKVELDRKFTIMFIILLFSNIFLNQNALKFIAELLGLIKSCISRSPTGIIIDPYEICFHHTLALCLHLARNTRSCTLPD